MNVAALRALGRGHDAPTGHHGLPGDGHYVSAPRQPTPAWTTLRVASGRLDKSHSYRGGIPSVTRGATCPHDHSPDYDDLEKENNNNHSTASLRSG
jgi:hypothetical protein